MRRGIPARARLYRTPNRRPALGRAERSTPWPGPRSSAPPGPLPHTAASASRAACALPEPGPIPAGFPTRPPPRSATARWNRCAPTPTAPITATRCRDHRSPAAACRVRCCAATAPPLTALAAPTTRPLAGYPAPPRRRSALLVTHPSPPPPALATGWRRSPSAHNCRSRCARSCC